ncbi:MAG: isochorismatase family protein [Pseudomonadota bacterium]|nr:isochorismatase family protein [Pseudomonadota bacterium]
MRLALSTALLVIDSQPTPDGVAGLIDGFRALDLPVIHIAGVDPSAFAETGLEASLEEQGVLTLVVCGSTPAKIAREAFDRGFRVFAAADAAAIAEVAAALDDLKQRCA